MKRILHVVESTATGTLSILLELCREQAAYYEITVAYGIRPDTPQNVEELFHACGKNITLIPVRAFTRSIHPYRDMRAFLEVSRIIRTVKPDIMHLHSSKAGAIGRLALLRRSVARVFERQDDGFYPVYYTPHGYGFLQKTSGSLKCRLYWAAEKICAKMPARTIACSKWEYGQARKLSPNCFYVNNGVPLAELDRLVSAAKLSAAVDGGTAEPEYDVYISGRITKARNPSLFNRIALACPHLRFLWIGDGEEREALTAPNITVTGYVSKEEAIRKAASVTVFLLPSDWEGLSISLLEAMAMRKICVVSRIPQNKAVIHHGKTGIVCETEAAYAGWLKTIVSEQAEKPIWKTMQMAARKELEQGYTTDIMAEKYRRIYENLPPVEEINS